MYSLVVDENGSPTYNDNGEILMYHIQRAQPNITPRHLAGSSTNSQSTAAQSSLQLDDPLNDPLMDTEDGLPAENFKKLTKQQQWEENIRRQDRYHAEMMEMQKESLDTFKEVMCKMLDVFQQNKSS